MGKCPVCRCLLIVTDNIDAGYCYYHGWVTGLDRVNCEGMAPWEALIEIRASQIQWQMSIRFQELRSELALTGRMWHNGFTG